MLQPERPNKVTDEPTATRLIEALSSSVRLQMLHKGSSSPTPSLELEPFEEKVLAESLASPYARVRSRAVHLVPHMKALGALHDEYTRALISTDVPREKVMLIKNIVRHVPARDAFPLLKCFAIDSAQPIEVRVAATSEVSKGTYRAEQKVELLEGLLRDRTAKRLIPQILGAVFERSEAMVSEPALETLFTHEDMSVVLCALRLRGRYLCETKGVDANPVEVALKDHVNFHNRYELSLQLSTALRSNVADLIMASLLIICSDATLAQRMRREVESHTVGRRSEGKGGEAQLPLASLRHREEDSFRANTVFGPPTAKASRSGYFPTSVSNRHDVSTDRMRINVIGLAAVTSHVPFDISNLHSVLVNVDVSAYAARLRPTLAFWSDVSTAALNPDAFFSQFKSRVEGDRNVPEALARYCEVALQNMRLVGSFKVNMLDGLAQCFVDASEDIRVNAAAIAIALGDRLEYGQVLSDLFPAGTTARERSAKALLMSAFQPSSLQTVPLVQQCLMSGSKAETVAGIWCAELMKEFGVRVAAEATLVGMSADTEIAQRARRVLGSKSFPIDPTNEGNDDSFFAFRQIA